MNNAKCKVYKRRKVRIDRRRKTGTTSDFLLYKLKTMAYFTSHHNTTSKHPRIPAFYVILQKKIMACGNAYVKHFAKIPDYFETQCWQP